MPQKKNTLELRQKVEIINEFELTHDKAVIMSKYNIPQSSFYKIINEKQKLLNDSVISNGTQKRTSKCKFEMINKYILEFIEECNSYGLNISGQLLMQEAQSFAQQNGHTCFKGSSGWLDKLKKKHHLVFRKLHGESASANTLTSSEYVSKIDSLIGDYLPENIYNTDETGLLWRTLPNKSIVKKNSKLKGSKRSKERLTILFFVSLTGEKRKPFIIGKSKYPRGLKNMNQDAIGVQYLNSDNAWMTKNLFQIIIEEWNTELVPTDRKILLFLDNVGSHNITSPSNITFQFLPPNTTALIQPLDQGIINSFKSHYKKLFLIRMLNQFKTTREVNIKHFKLIDSIQLISTAWTSVNKSTIVNCFNQLMNKKNDNTVEGEMKDKIALEQILNKCLENNIINNDISVDEYLTIDVKNNYDRDYLICNIRDKLAGDIKAQEALTKPDIVKIMNHIQNLKTLTMKSLPMLTKDILLLETRVDEELLKMNDNFMNE